MHGGSLASVLQVNAEVDSMRGVIESGGSVGIRASPQRTVVEKVQAELRQEYDVREERRRELEFLETGGNPLNFRFGNATSCSVQSTSLADQCHEIEAKTSFAFAASVHGDSVESSGRPGTPPACEPNSADNLIFFSGEKYSIDGDKESTYSSGKNAALTKHSFQLNGSQNAKETKGAAVSGSTRKAYRRRDRPSLDSARSSSSDVMRSRGCNEITIPSFHGPREFKELISDLDKQDRKILPNGALISTCANMGANMVLPKALSSDTQLDAELDVVKAVKSTNDPIHGGLPDNVRDATENLNDDQQKLELVLGVCKSPFEQISEQTESFRAREVVFAEGLESRPSLPICLLENQANFGQTRGFNSVNRDLKSSPNSGNNDGLDAKNLDSESSCTQSIIFSDGNNDTEMYTQGREGDKDGNDELTCILYGNESVQACQVIQEKKEIKADENFTHLNDECILLRQTHKEDGLLLKAGEGLNGSASYLEKERENQNQDEVKDQNTVESMDVDGGYGSEAERTISISLVDAVNTKMEDVCSVEPQGFTSNVTKLPETSSPAGVSSIASARQTSSANLVPSKADEDLILEEARVIEAKHKMIAQFVASSSSMCYRKKSHWDSVLEEMAWLANDFAQERLWKVTAASQVCRQASFVSCSRFHEHNSYLERKKVAHFLATAVLKFWHSLEHTSQEQKLQCCNENYSHALRDYALKFQMHNNEVLQAEAPVDPMTQNRMSDLGIMDMPFDDRLPEENIFYKALPGAIEKYGKSMESHVKYEKTGSSIQEEVETSTCDAIADFVLQDNVLEEDEGETSTYNMPVSSRSSPKKRKFLTKANGSNPFEVVFDSQFVQCMERKVGSQHPVSLGKCPAGSLNVSFRTRRVRTSNRQRVLIPLSGGRSACVQVPTKVDASSGDTSSFHDDLSTLHDGSRVLNNLELESAGDFEKEILYDPDTTTSKKKKVKYLESAYEQRWQADSNYRNDQRSLSTKRLNSHQFESNGLFGQRNAKKQKITRQPTDSSFDSSAQVGGSAPSHVASQNSNPNKLGKYFGGRDRGRGNKGLKVTGQPGSGNRSPWSLFEDQALVVLVHDLGPNWDLISDAINSTSQYKCIFRKPKECKERHKQLMDRPAGDGADSAEDSGSSQPYSSTLPGIPKGSARQLFQRLQGPMEEDTLKSHFDKIIMIGQKLHCRRKQDPKQIQPPHGSHMAAFDNLIGGPILTPLDVCEETASNVDALPLGYQGPHSGGLPFGNQGTMTSALATSGANSLISGSPNMILGNSFPSSPTPINASVRDGRHAVSRSSSLSIEEKQRTQQLNQMFPARNFTQSNISSPGTLQGNDRAVRMLPQGNGAPITSCVSRNSPIVRPGFASPSVLNSGSMMSSGMVAMPSTANIYTGVASGQGNLSRPCDSLQMMQPTQNHDSQRQMMVPELQMPASQGIPPFGVQISPFPNQTASPLLPPYSLHPQQPRAMSPQHSHVVTSHHPHLQGINHAPTTTTHQAYAMHLAKGKPLQQHFFQQPQQQFASSNTSQIAQQTSTTPASLSPFTPGSPVTVAPQKLAHGPGQNAQTANSIKNQIGKQRRQPQSQKKQRQSQSQQQVKTAQALGRGKSVMNNMSIEPTIPNGFSMNPEYHSLKKGEKITHLSEGQGLYSGSPMNHVPSGKLSVLQSSSQSHPHQRMYPGQASSLSEHAHHLPRQSDGVYQGPISPVSSGSVPPVVMNASGQSKRQTQGNQKLVNQSELSVQRVLHQSLHGNSELTMLLGNESQTDQIPVVNPSQMGNSIIMPNVPNGLMNNVSQFTSPASPQSRDLAPLNDSGTSSRTNMASVALSCNSAMNGTSSQVGQRLGQNKPSDNLPPGGHDVISSTQWQQQPPDSHGNQRPSTAAAAATISVSAVETGNG